MYQALKAMTGDSINLKSIRTQWNEVLRLATSIKQGRVTASLMLRKLGSYPRQNGLAVALRELGRVERTLFILSWLQSVDFRRPVHAGLNKSGAQCTRKSCIPLPPWGDQVPQLRAATLPRKRLDMPHSGNRALEHLL